MNDHYGLKNLLTNQNITNPLCNQEGGPEPREANPKNKDQLGFLTVQHEISTAPKVFQ